MEKLKIPKTIAMLSALHLCFTSLSFNEKDCLSGIGTEEEVIYFTFTLFFSTFRNIKNTSKKYFLSLLCLLILSSQRLLLKDISLGCAGEIFKNLAIDRIKGRNGIEKQYTSEHSEHGSEGTDSSAYLGGPETVFQ